MSISISAFPVGGPAAPAAGTVTTGQPAAQSAPATNDTSNAPEGECQCQEMILSAYNRYRLQQILTIIFWFLIILLILKAIFS